MRFAHMSDTHLGYRQLGIQEREEDYYRLFERTIDKIIELDVDFVIHSGDLFDNYRPSTDTLLAFQRALIKLQQADIPFYAIVGNHDSRLRKNAKPPLVLFRDLGVNLIKSTQWFVHDDVFICGVPYTEGSKSDALIDKMNRLAVKAKEYPKSILLLHQAIKGYFPAEVSELTLDDLPKNFDYYAMGHLHHFRSDDLKENSNFEKGVLTYCGSMEVHDVGENMDKGFALVDLTQSPPNVEKINVGLERMLYDKVIEYENFDEEIIKFKNEIAALENKPVVDLTIKGGDFDSSLMQEKISSHLKGLVLNLRPIFKPQKVLDEETKIKPDQKLDFRTVLNDEILKKYDDETISKLSVGLLDRLSVGNIDDAKALSEDYFYRCYDIFEDEHENGEEAPAVRKLASLDDF